jgi:hypothetical protein
MGIELRHLYLDLFPGRGGATSFTGSALNKANGNLKESLEWSRVRELVYSSCHSMHAALFCLLAHAA